MQRFGITTTEDGDGCVAEYNFENEAVDAAAEQDGALFVWDVFEKTLMAVTVDGVVFRDWSSVAVFVESVRSVGPTVERVRQDFRIEGKSKER